MTIRCLDDNNILTDRKTFVGNIPIRLIYKNRQFTASENGCIIFYHGLGASKDKQTKELEELACAGFLAIGVDNVGHGERLYKDFDERFSEDNPDRIKNILKTVWDTASEIKTLIYGLVSSKILINDKLGVAGISMGAFVSYAVATLEPRIKTIVSILGSPTWGDYIQSPHHNIDKYSEVSLLSMNAGLDEIVPAEKAREFHMDLKKHYSDYDSRFKYIEYPNSGHFMEENDWNSCWQECMNWFEARL